MIDSDNNLVENQIRPFAIGRKNWQFNNNAKGAKAAAVLYSLVTAAKANRLDPFRYLMDVLAKTPHCETAQDFAELIPTANYFG